MTNRFFPVVIDGKQHLLTEDRIATLLSQAESFVHQQLEPSQVWQIAHGLDRYPSITVRDNSDQVILGDVVYNSSNLAAVTFSVPLTGTAYCI